MTGALVGRAFASNRPRALSARAVTAAGTAAAVFPDTDFVLNAFGQIAYLDLHQGVTHSLPMMPVWAWLLAAASAWIYDRRSWRRAGGRLQLILAFLPITFAGLAVHTVADAINIWGVMLWWPLHEARTALNAIFVIDPLYTALVLLGLALSSAWRVRAGALVGLALVGAYTLVAIGVNAHTDRVLAGLPASQTALAASQHAAPPSLLHRRFVLRDEHGWRYAFVDLNATTHRAPGARWVSRFSAAFRPVGDAEWHTAMHPLDGGAFVADAWAQPALAGFRDFVVLPFVHEVGPDGAAMCAWFSDLRFTLPEVAQPFVWGACRSGDGAWEVRQRGRW